MNKSDIHNIFTYTAAHSVNELEFRADTEEFSNKYNLKCFEGQKICFVEFPTVEHKLMLEMLETNGGVHVELGDPECSHIVVGQHATPVKPELKSNRTHILISDWFWYTIKKGYAIEKNYLFDDSVYSSVAQCESLAYKETLIKNSSMRFIYFLDFYTTESNYVEESVQDSDALLNEFKIKAIFDYFLPIHEVHQSLFAHLGVLAQQLNHVSSSIEDEAKSASTTITRQKYPKYNLKFLKKTALNEFSSRFRSYEGFYCVYHRRQQHTIETIEMT
uniref:BRCT domain-containing protein n=1 Tax=Glossina palpalis gambiensis TaxID=67801 RepID=A0A1B0AST8_9MUSC